MPDQARLDPTEHGLVPKGEGWFVLNAQEAPWWQSPYFGASTSFEGEPQFPEYCMNIHVALAGAAERALPPRERPGGLPRRRRRMPRADRGRRSSR